MITTLTAIVNTDTDTGVNDYPANYKVTDKAHVHVYYVDGETPEVELVQVEVFTGGTPNEYKVNLITESGFNVELRDTYATATGRKLSIRREVPFTQEVEYPPGNDFPGSTHERALDKLTAIVQEFNERIVRQLGLPLSEEATDLLLPAYISNYYLGLDGDNNLKWKVGTVAVGNDEIKDSHIDWGTGSEQVSAVDMPIADAEGKITAVEVEGALQENRIALDVEEAALVAHKVNNGSDHSYIDQDVKTTATPEFAEIIIAGETYIGTPSFRGLKGSGFSIAGLIGPSITALDSTHIAFIDDTLEELRTYLWNGSVWALQGSGFSISGISFPVITALDSTHVAFIDGALDSLRTYIWNGSVWALEGSGLSVTQANPAITALDSTHIALMDSSVEELKTFVWNGSVWALEGSGLSISGVGYVSLAALDSTHVAFVASTLNSLRTYVWNGSVWALEGSSLAVTGLAVVALTKIKKNYVVLTDSALDTLTVYYWDGSIWLLVETGYSITGGMTNPALATLDTKHIVFIDATLEELRTYSYSLALRSL